MLREPLCQRAGGGDRGGVTGWVPLRVVCIEVAGYKCWLSMIELYMLQQPVDRTVFLPLTALSLPLLSLLLFVIAVDYEEGLGDADYFDNLQVGVGADVVSRVGLDPSIFPDVH